MNATEESTRWKVAITLAVLGGSAAAMSHSVHRDTPYFMVHELVDDGLARHAGQDVRAHGFVMGGSIVGDDRARSFVLEQGGKRLRVFATGPVPDRFKDQTEIVVTGEIVPAREVVDAAWRLGVALDDDHALVSSGVIMRCTDWRERSPPDGALGFR